jgi:hypothetical protein
VLAVTTSGRSSAILYSKNRQLRKGFDVTAEPTTSGVDATRPPLRRAAAITRSCWATGLLVVAVAALSDHQPPDPRARSNQ